MPLDLNIPGLGRITLKHLVLDLNGTLARDGAPLEGVQERLEQLAPHLELHLVTADTFGTAGSLFGSVVKLHTLASGDEGAQKAAIINALGPDNCLAMGNGANDCLMLESASIGVAVLGPEGLCSEAMMASDIVTPGPLEALELLLEPKRLVATLRR